MGKAQNSKILAVPWAREFCRDAFITATWTRRQRPSGRATTNRGTSGTVFCDEKSKWEREPLKRWQGEVTFDWVILANADCSELEGSGANELPKVNKACCWYQKPDNQC